MKTAKQDQVKAAPVFGGAAKREATSGDTVRAGLRGKAFDEQEAALKPGGKGGAGGEKAHDSKGQQPAPHALKGLGKGKFHLFVEGQSAHFHQRVRVAGAQANLPAESAPAVGAPIEVDAKGPWSLSVEHRVPEGTTWAAGRPKGWSASTHKELSRGVDHLDVGTEDFKDGDFDDLVLSVVRADQDDGAAYLVESETRVEGYQTSYDLILGASASGRLDVVLDAQVITPAELGRVDGQALAAMAERFAGLRSKLASSVEHEAKRKQLEEEIARWERAVAMARAQASGAKKAPEAKAPAKAAAAAPKVG